MRSIKRLINFTILFLLTIVTLAQQPKDFKEQVEKIYKQYPQFIKEELNGFIEKDDTSTINKLNNIGDYYLHYKPDSAVIYAMKSLEISKRINYKEGINSSYQTLINKYRENGGIPEALNYANNLYRFSQENKDTSQMILTLVEISNLWLNTKNYRYAIESANKAISIMNDFKNWPKKEVGVNKEIYKMETYTLNQNLAISYNSISMKDSAFFYFNRSYEAISGLSSEYNWDKSEAMLGFANFYYNNKDYELAIGYINKNLILDNPNVFDYDRNLLFLKVYIEIKKTDSAVKYLKLLPKFNYSSNDSKLSNEIDRVETTIKYFKLINNKDSILRYQNILLSLKDTAYNQEEIKRLESIKLAETVKDFELQEKQKHDEKERSNNIKLGAISIFIPTFTAIVFYLGRRKSKNTKIFTLMGLASLLMLFEFISLLIHPYVEHLTNHDAILMYLILLIIASILVPIHHKLEKWVKEQI